MARWLAAVRVRQATGFLNDTVIVTLAAQALTLPLIVLYFGRLSLISLITNFLILPAQPPIMIGGMAAVVGGLIWEPFGRALAAVPWLFLSYTTAIVRLTAAVPLASVRTDSFGQIAALLYLGVLFGAMLWRAAHRRGWTAIPARRALAWVAAIMLPAWLGVTVLEAWPDGLLHLFFVPGEGGEAALVVMPDGKRAWLWDGRGDGAGAGGRGAAVGCAVPAVEWMPPSGRLDPTWGRRPSSLTRRGSTLAPGFAWLKV